MSAKNLVQLLLLAAIWGGSFLFLRICAPVLGAVPTAFGRVLFAALGLALLAARDFGAPIPPLVLLHLLAVGALGLMTLGMMTRVSLGHTGRAIVADRRTTLAFVLLLMAAAVRAGGPFLYSGNCRMVMLLAAGLWIGAFTIFLITYVKVLA